MKQSLTRGWLGAAGMEQSQQGVDWEMDLRLPL